MSSASTTKSPQNPRVLTVDDNEIHCYALHKLLQSAGFDVTSAHSGHQALEAFRQLHPDAVLLDIGLKDMSGFEVCDQIRAEKANDQVAIVFHSASGHGNAGAHNRSGNGADAFLTYTVDPEHLISVIRGCIQRRIDNVVSPPAARAKHH